MVGVYTEFSRPLLAAAAAAAAAAVSYSCRVSDYGQGGETHGHMTCIIYAPNLVLLNPITRLGSRERTQSHPCICKASAQR